MADDGWANFERDIAFHPAVVGMIRNMTARAGAAARAGASVKTGHYKASIREEIDLSGHVPVGRVIADDPAAMAIEAYTGNLARAAKAARPR